MEIVEDALANGKNDHETFEDLSTAIDKYIYFYNHDRYQERLNGFNPIEYRAKAV
ncbi:IS3 family transposase [Oceanobacillus profundus]|uniref:IS3 family transposase n=1 Tax=Oceanobacillus TaxID=182709 RepID=UPI0026E3457D|nr:IS3 family transposase [Oceanobacillus profundus]MDO6450871.1 IS3 family transposase [Oceanobacillus profundus]